MKKRIGPGHPDKRLTRLEYHILENCFPVKEIDIGAMLIKVREAGVCYGVISELSGVPESNIRHFVSIRSRQTGKVMMNGYRLCNALNQIINALKIPEAARYKREDA